MKNTIIHYDIECLWHFTDESNLASIRKHGGLWSLAKLREMEVDIPTPGGNQWSHDEDERIGLDQYIHLTFCTDSPMLWVAQNNQNRIPNPCWLAIERDLLFGEGVRFCAGVANKSGAEILDAEQAKKQIDFEVLFQYTDWNDPEIRARRNEARKSEILIPNHIPFENISIK